jgi:hypothetical protein
MIVVKNKWLYFGIFIASFLSVVFFVNDDMLLMILAFVIAFAHPYIIKYEGE